MPLTLAEFETGSIGHAPFRHADHVRIGYELISTQPFDVALARFVGGLRAITTAAGQPAKLHMTITVAFLAAIAERHAQNPDAPWEQFAAANPDLLDRAVLQQWYRRQELETHIARTTFVLPLPPAR